MAAKLKIPMEFSDAVASLLKVHPEKKEKRKPRSKRKKPAANASGRKGNQP